MDVRLIASTAYYGIGQADELAEFAGRACYQSWDRPNPATATTHDYLANILRNEHYSVLEHASATFYITGVSRSLTHELVRHRHLSFSQLSQRFVANDIQYVPPPNADVTLRSRISDRFEELLTQYEIFLQYLDQFADNTRDLTTKEKREIARAILPNCTATKIVVTGNHRAWREFLIKRGTAAADAEIRQLALRLYGILRHEVAPSTYQDLHVVDGYIHRKDRS